MTDRFDNTRLTKCNHEIGFNWIWRWDFGAQSSNRSGNTRVFCHLRHSVETLCAYFRTLDILYSFLKVYSKRTQHFEILLEHLILITLWKWQPYITCAYRKHHCDALPHHILIFVYLCMHCVALSELRSLFMQAQCAMAKSCDNVLSSSQLFPRQEFLQNFVDSLPETQKLD